MICGQPRKLVKIDKNNQNPHQNQNSQQPIQNSVNCSVNSVGKSSK